jgi:hypothetical protein
MKWTTCAALAILAAWTGPVPAENATVTLESLLREMTDRDAVARWPLPEYACRQASSYDRKSRTPNDAAGWFANGDNLEMMNAPAPWVTRQGRSECVLLDVDGPGAVVRFWSGGAPPKGKVRFYLDGAEEPAIEAPLFDLLGGRSFVPRPLAIENSGAAINLYLPVPYARHCTITYDEGKPPKAPPGRWYNIEYRAYPAGTPVQTFTMGELGRLKDAVDRTARTLAAPPAPAGGKASSLEQAVEPGKEVFVALPAGPAAVRLLEARIEGVPEDQIAQALRSTVLRIAFDGTETVWCPLGDFFGSGPGVHPLNSWHRTVAADGTMTCRWVMPYATSARITVANLGAAKASVRLKAETGDWAWDDRSMHFHSTWRQQRLIPTRPFSDWNYVTVTGKGVYLGDTLALFNPAKNWWGEGDEKIRVDGEAFPSHFGTGSEDYYGYAWGHVAPFQGPFCSQPVAHPGNLGHTTNTRTRCLDAIPFAKSLQFDMEIWHWADCKVDYAAAAYWYAAPGATSNRKPEPEEAAAVLRELAGPVRLKGAVECEAMKVLGTSEGLKISTQSGYPFAEGRWSGETQLFVQATKPGDFIELLVAEKLDGPRKVTLHATKSYDYGILRLTVNGRPVAAPFDGYAPQPGLSGPVELGVFEPKDGRCVVRVEVLDANPASKGPRFYFGLDAVILSTP